MNNMVRKKILYIHHGKGLGGAPLSLLYLIKSLDQTRYEPIVLFLHHSEVIDLYKKEGITVVGPVGRYDFSHTKIYWFAWYHAHYVMRSIKDTLITLLFSAPYWLRKINPDIVHLNTSSLIAWGAAARRKGIKIVWHIREPLAPGYCGLRRAIVQKSVARYANVIVPICKHDAQPWASMSKTHVLHNPVDARVFDTTVSSDSVIKKYNIDISQPTLLFLGGLSQEKGTLQALRIFEQVLKIVPAAQLLLAGYCDLSCAGGMRKYFPMQKYKDKVSTLLNRLGDRVIRCGIVRNVPELMAASSVVLFPATVGHFARPIIEAGFMKKPVLASALPPLDELVVDGKTGFLLDPHQPQQWADRFAELMTDSGLYHTIAQQAYDFCWEHFEVGQYAKKMMDLYKEL